jgi:protein-histidine pros-kinase
MESRNPKAPESNADWQEGAFQQLFESAPDAAIVVDVDGRIVLANAHAEELFRYTREELVGQSVELLVPERFQEAHVQQRRDYMDEPRKRPMGHPGVNLRGRRKDGTEFPAEIALGPLELDRGFFVTAIVRDTSRHRGADEEHAIRHRVEEYAALLRNSLTHRA